MWVEIRRDAELLVFSMRCDGKLAEGVGFEPMIRLASIVSAPAHALQRRMPRKDPVIHALLSAKRRVAWLQKIADSGSGFAVVVNHNRRSRRDIAAPVISLHATLCERAVRWLLPWERGTHYPGLTRGAQALFHQPWSVSSVTQWRSGRRPLSAECARDILGHLEARTRAGLDLCDELRRYIQTRETVEAERVIAKRRHGRLVLIGRTGDPAPGDPPIVNE